MMRQNLNAISLFVAALAWVVAFSVTQYWPSSYWIEVRDVRVFDAQYDAPVPMAVDRTIKRDFLGRWVASIRRLENGGWVQFCTASGRTNYATDSKLPDPLTLKWWTYPDCNPLPPGKYTMRTSWVISGEGFMPDKEARADSNIFEIRP